MSLTDVHAEVDAFATNTVTSSLAGISRTSSVSREKA